MREVRLDTAAVQAVLHKIRNVKICVVGDISLDLYWFADMTRSQLSRETPHFPLPVVRERSSLGGGGNVVANIAALGAGLVIPVSVVGDDWRGHLLRRQLEQIGVTDEHVFNASGRVTPTYCKPIRQGISDVRYEDPRIDFENFESLPPPQEEKVVQALWAAAEQCDAIAVCDQYRFGVVTERLRDELAKIGRSGKVVIVDSRDKVGSFRDVIVKPNEVEAAAALGTAIPKQGNGAYIREYGKAVHAIAQKNGKPAAITLGSVGALWADGESVCFAPAHDVPGPFDIVGAGDTFLAALVCAYAAGVPGPEALAFGNIASSVTIQKIGETGVATPEEVLRQSGVSQ